jgi:hypothetical protein
MVATEWGYAAACIPTTENTPSTHPGELGPKGNHPAFIGLCFTENVMSATRIVRIMLVKDHLSFRQALAFLRGHEPDLEVVAQAGSLAQARQMLHTPLDGSITLLSRSPGPIRGEHVAGRR